MRPIHVYILLAMACVAVLSDGVELFIKGWYGLSIAMVAVSLAYCWAALTVHIWRKRL